MYRAWLTAHVHTKICRGPKDTLEGLGQQRPFQFVVQTYLPVLHLGAVVAAGGHKLIRHHAYRFLNFHICRVRQSSCFDCVGCYSWNFDLVFEEMRNQLHFLKPVQCVSVAPAYIVRGGSIPLCCRGNGVQTGQVSDPVEARNANAAERHANRSSCRLRTKTP